MKNLLLHPSPGRLPFANNSASQVCIANAFDALAQVALTKKFMNRRRAAIPGVVVVKNDKPAFHHLVIQLIQAAFDAGVPVGIESGPDTFKFTLEWLLPAASYRLYFGAEGTGFICANNLVALWFLATLVLGYRRRFG